MKKSISLLAAVAITLSVYAQTDTSRKSMTPPDFKSNSKGEMNKGSNHDMNNNAEKSTQPQRKEKPMQDGVMMKGGKMMVVKNGTMSKMDADVTMGNGTKVMSNGNAVKKDGSQSMLKEGEHMDMSGKMIPMKKDSIR